MNTFQIIDLFIVVLIGIVFVYRVSRLLIGSAPRRTKVIRGISMALGFIVVLILVGLQMFHIIH